MVKGMLVCMLLTVLHFGAHAQCAGNWLTASGTKLYDSQNKEVRLTGINWFGFETSNKAPHGLWSRDTKSMLMQIKDLGFNCVRIPYSNAILDPGATMSGISTAPVADPYTGRKLNEAEGKLTHPLQLLDLIVQYCQELNLKIILDNHSRNPDGYLSEELWYTSSVPHNKWVSDWVAIATRYKNNDAVIAMDIDNEPHGKNGSGARWGSGTIATDWRMAAQECGNAILAVNPNVLIMVEGVEEYNGQTYWWGGNLQGVTTYPVQLSNNKKLVYSPHEYGPTVYPQPWFTDPSFPSNMAAIWEKNFNFIHTKNMAPLFAGEFGIKTQGGQDEVWFDTYLAFMGQKGYSWTFWCWNPNSGDTGGILTDDWTTIHTWKMNKLKPYLAAAIPNGCQPQTGFTITASAGAGGSITPSGSVSVAQGANQSFTITASSGYSVKDVVVDGVSKGAINTFTFSNVTANHTIAASFKSNTVTYAITSSAGTGGTISPLGTMNVNSGSNQTYTISPASGYAVNSVLVDGTSVGAVTTYTFTNVTANHTISVSFKTTPVVQYTITASAGAGGAISPSGNVVVNAGANQTFTITPGSGYEVSNVVVNGVSAGAVTSYTFTNVQSNKTIAASFKQVTSNNCKFGTPRASYLPTIPYKQYNFVHVLGTGGPNLSNVTNFTINWDYENNGLWQFSMSTNNGSPNWYVDLRPAMTYSFRTASPSLTLTGSGFPGLDGTYYVNTHNGNFVMVSTTKPFTIYYSTSATPPVCTTAARVRTLETTEEVLVTAFPNPFHSHLMLQIAEPEKVDNIALTNQLGQVIMSVPRSDIRHTTTLQVTDAMPKGLYIINISGAASRRAIKVWKE